MVRRGTTKKRAEQLNPEVLRWAQTAKYEYLACRDVRHAWPIDPDSLRWAEENYNYRPVRVRRAACIHGCGVTRVQMIDVLTGKWNSDLVYPKPENGGRSDYLLPLGCGRLDKNAIFQLNEAALASPPTKSQPAASTGRSRKPTTPRFAEPTKRQSQRLKAVS